MSTEHVLFVTAIMMAVTAAALGLAQRLNLGSIAGLLLVGILLGPHSPVPLFTNHVGDFEAFGAVGVILLLFMIGLDTQPRRLWLLRKLVLGFGSLEYVACVTLTTTLLFVVSRINWQSALVLGLGLSMSSSAVPLPLLQLRGESDSPHGRLTLAADVLQSLVLVGVMLVVPLLGPNAAHLSPLHRQLQLVEALFALVAVWVLGRGLMPVALSAVSRGGGTRAFTLAVLAGVFAAAWVMGSVGASMALGAFLLGVLLSTSSFATQIKAAVVPARQILLGVFFIAVGMGIDLKQAAALRGEILFYLPVVLVIKLAAIYLSARVFRVGSRTALLTGLLLMPLDEVGYVIFAQADASGLLSAKAHTLALLSISFSFVVSPLLIELGLRRAARDRARRERASVESVIRPSARGCVVVFGYGGLGRTLCALFEQAQVGYVCFDPDPNRVKGGCQAHHDVLYGNLADEELIEVADLAEARLIAVTLPDVTQTREVLMALRARAPAVPVWTAVQQLAERDVLRGLGVGRVLALAPEGAIVFTRAILESIAVDSERARAILGTLSANDYEALRDPELATARVTP